MTRVVAVSLVVALGALAACGNRTAAPPPELPQPVERLDLPDPIPAEAALVVTDRSLTPETVDYVENLEGVAVVAAAARARLPVEVHQQRVRLRVAAVDPIRLRPLAPVATRDASFVWASLLEGRALVSFAARKRLGIDGAVTVTVGGADVAVGAYADAATPTFADVVLNERVGSEVVKGPPDLLVVGVKPNADVERLRTILRRALPQARVERVRKRPQPVASPGPVEQPELPQTYSVAGMTFRILKNGFIEPDAQWVATNIATAEVPILGPVRCHRIMFEQLYAALSEIVERGLADLIDPSQYAGCYVPRFIDRDPRRGLSMHAFGLAVDLNVAENQLGTTGNMDPRVVAIFEKWGFEWGGRWSRPDPMHFELDRIIDVS